MQHSHRVAVPSLRLREGPDLVAELRERLLELHEAFPVGFRKLPLQPSLPEPKEQLARRLERDLLFVLERVELGEQGRQIAVGGLLPQQIGPRAPMGLVVEVLRAEQLELGQKRLVARDACERAAF